MTAFVHILDAVSKRAVFWMWALVWTFFTCIALYTVTDADFYHYGASALALPTYVLLAVPPLILLKPPYADHDVTWRVRWFWIATLAMLIAVPLLWTSVSEQLIGEFALFAVMSFGFMPSALSHAFIVGKAEVSDNISLPLLIASWGAVILVFTPLVVLQRKLPANVRRGLAYAGLAFFALILRGCLHSGFCMSGC